MNGLDLERVAYALAKVIAAKTVAADPSLRRLDGLGKVTAVHELATRMVPELSAEAEAVAYEVSRQLLTEKAG